MDATQVLDDFDEEELNNSGSKKTVAFLKVQAVGDFPETLFPVYEGENIIGRHDNCDITIPLQAVSKKHACIDVHGKNHLICDYNSRNKTQRNQMFLKPQAFYELVNEVELSFADVTCQYIFAQTEDVVEKDTVSDSGSETASESMMPQSTEDDEEPEEAKKEKVAGSPKNEEPEESVEKYLNQPTQDYSYKNPDENSPVFCAETDDDETDDERDDKDETSPGIGSLSLSKEQTPQHSLESNDPTTAATMPCNTLPNTLEPDTIPETPFTQSNDFEPPFKLKRSVDVKVDTSRRISAGNTLAYGLSTLESPNSTRESMDVSESEKEELSGEGTSQVKNKLLFDNTTDQRSPNNNDKRLPDSMSKQDEILDDLLATQLYEPMEIPESPEFLQPFGTEESTEIKDKEPPENKTPEGEKISEGTVSDCQTSEGKTSEGKISEGTVSEGQISEGETSKGKISEGTVSESQTSEGKTSKGKISEGITSEGKISEDKIFDDMMETQAYGLDTLPQDEYEDMATQAYGLMFDADSADTGDELEATQAYGDDLEVPKMSGIFKVPGAMNTQDLNEDGGIGGRDETAAHNEKVGNEDYDDEMDIQATQNYIENQVKESGETSESSDNLPSLSSFMGLKSDSDSDFRSAKKSSRRKVETKAAPQESLTPAAVKSSSSIVIEGDNPISTEKRCYVECPGVEDETSRDKEHDNRRTSTRKKSVRGGKKSAATRSKVEDEPNEDTAGVSTTPAKDDLPTTRNDTMTSEDTDEQRETIVIKRGKGRSTRGKKSAATTRSSRGKKNEAVAEDVAEEAEVESLPKGRRSRRKRKISEENPKTESKNEAESSIVKGDVENMETENKAEKLNMSDDEEDNDMFKLQISAVDSPETDDFIPKKKHVLETKRPARRGKKATTEELESNDESETTNVEVEKQLAPRAKRSVSTKSARKSRGKKNQDLPEVDNDENVTESVSKQAEMIDSNKDGQTLGNQKDSMVKSTKKGRSKKSQGVTEVDSNENIREDVAKEDEMVEKKKDRNTQGQQKDSVEKSTESVEQELPDAMTPVVNTRISRGGRKGKQTTTKKSRNGASGNAVQNLERVQDKNEMDEPASNVDETKMKEPKTPARGRARKRKSSENSNENTQQKKGTAKKSRKNTTTEENSETKDETHHGRETTASPQDDIKFESPELTPRSLSKRSSSTASTSSTSSVSRSARKGKKQEKEDSEGSIDHSSNVKIVFTGLQDNAFVKAKKIVQTLGGKVVERLEDCTHLVTDKVRRTVKLLCAVSRGIPVVDMSWLDASKKSKSFVDSSSFILEDKEAQKKFNFSMERSLELAQNAGLLDGYKIHVTPHVRPPPNDMKEIIKSAKGEIVSKMPTSRDNDVIVLSCDEDKELCEKAHVVKAYTAELLLTGILRQKLDLDQNKLSFNTTSDINSDPNTPVKSKGRRRR